MKTIYTLILACIVFSCNDSKPVNTRLVAVGENDTIISITINTITKDYVIHKSTLKDISEFVKFINKFGNTLEYKHEDWLEITGDGFSNKYTTWIKPNQDGFLVSNTIEQNDSTIWTDSILINDRIWYYWEDSVFFQLKPYSQFYMAYNYFSNTIGEPFDTTSNFYKSNKPIIHYYIKYDQDSTYWDSFLGNFKGRLIYNLSMEDASTYIWDRKQHKFIEMYEP